MALRTVAAKTTTRLSAVEYPPLSTQTVGDECGLPAVWPAVWPVPHVTAEGSVDAAQVTDN